MQVDVHVLLTNNDSEPFIGIGIVWLLIGIEKHHSITRAAREMKLSYPKALRLIGNLEKGLGQPIVVRRKGGSEGGGAELTPFGSDFVRRFDRMQNKIRRFAAAAFEKDFARSPYSSYKEAPRRR